MTGDQAATHETTLHFKSGVVVKLPTRHWQPGDGFDGRLEVDLDYVPVGATVAFIDRLDLSAVVHRQLPPPLPPRIDRTPPVQS